MSIFKSRAGIILVLGAFIWVGATIVDHQNKVSAVTPNILNSQTVKVEPQTDLNDAVNQVGRDNTTLEGLSETTNLVNQSSNSFNTAYVDNYKAQYNNPLYSNLGYSTSNLNPFTQNTALADSDDSMTNPELQLGSSAGVSYFISKVNTFTSTDLGKNSQARPFTAFSQKNIGGSPVIYLNKVGYDKQPVKVKQQVLQVMYKALDDSEITTRDKNRIYNWLESLDQVNSAVAREFSQNTSADLYGAQKVLMPFQSKIGIVLGILTLTIALALTFSFVWDMAFLSIPFFTLLLTRNNDVSLSNRPFLVSQDAVLAYIESNDKGQQALMVWFKLRMKSSIIIGICLTYLISNQIWQLVSFLVDIVSRFIN